MDTITEIRGKRAELATKAAALRAQSDRSTEDNEAYDLAINQIRDVDTEIEREERFLESEKRDADYMRRNGNSVAGATTAPTETREPWGSTDNGDTPKVVTLRMLENGGVSGRQGDHQGIRDHVDIQAYRDKDFSAFMGQLRSSHVSNGDYSLRALQVDDADEGGTLVRPEQFVARLIQAVDDQVFIRGLATVFQVADATSLGAPSLDTDPADADWTVELGTGSEDTAMRFGKRSLTPHPMAKRIKVSKALLRLAALGAESIVLGRLGYKFGITQEKGFLTGTGSNQPLGVFTASADGISTGRDVSTGNTTTAITFDGLIEAQFSVKGQYWPRARWLFHRDAIKLIAKIKDGEGRYMWEPAVRASEPDLLRGRPLTISEYAPNTFTTGQYVGMYGDFSNYWIADSMSMELQRLVELYAETNQIGFIGRLETDGMPVLEEAFARVTLA